MVTRILPFASEIVLSVKLASSQTSCCTSCHLMYHMRFYKSVQRKNKTLAVISGMIIEFLRAIISCLGFYSVLLFQRKSGLNYNTEFTNFSEKPNEGVPRKKNVSRLS